MIIKILSTGVLAFLLTKLFGKKYIPWLEKHSFMQPLKEKVVSEIYENMEVKEKTE